MKLSKQHIQKRTSTKHLNQKVKTFCKNALSASLIGIVIYGCGDQKARSHSEQTSPPMTDSLASPSPLLTNTSKFSYSDMESEYSIVLPKSYENSKEDYGVLVYFHGDGHNTSKFIDSPEIHSEIGEKLKIILVAIGAPNSSSAWWSPRKHDRAQLVSAFMDQLVNAKYRVDQSRIYFSGLSGGSNFINAFGIYTGFKLRINYILLCGGDIPRENSEIDISSSEEGEDDHAMNIPKNEVEAHLDHASFYYAVGKDDWIREDSQIAEQFYKQLGFHSHFDLLDSADAEPGHCKFSLPKLLKKGLAFFEKA